MTGNGALPEAPAASLVDTGSWAKLDRHGHDRYLRFAVGANYLESPFGTQQALDALR